MTSVHEDPDDIFDIMQLLGGAAPASVTEQSSIVPIKPDVSRIKKALTTPSGMDELLSKHIERHLHVTGVGEYICKYAIKKLIQETPGGKVYDEFHNYKERIIERLHLSILQHTEHISLSKRLGERMKTILLAHKYWSTLTDTQKRERCCSIMVTEDAWDTIFIDLSFFYEKQVRAESNLQHWEHEAFDEFGAAPFGVCRFMGQSSGLPGSVNDQLTVEEVIMVCTDHIAQRDVDLQMSNEQAVQEMLGLILEKIKNKNSRNQNRISSLIDGITITTLLHRIRSGHRHDYPNGDPLSPVRLSVSQFPLFMQDIVISGLLTTKARKQLLSLPEGEQRTRLKFIIEGATLHIAIKPMNPDEIKKMGFQPPFIVDFTKLMGGIRQKLREESQLNNTDYAKLNTTALVALKRFRTMSEKDREMFMALEQKRFMHLLSIEKERCISKAGVPADTLESLKSSRFFADLYLLSTDAGVRVSKLRTLVKMVYQNYLPAPEGTGGLGFRGNASHDILTNYEKNFMTFLRGWQPYPRFSQILNRIIDLLISQLGGAQGDVHRAFALWGKLPALVGKELVLLEMQPKNMDEVFICTRTDKNYIRKATPLLNNMSPSVVGQEQLHKYVSNSVGNEAFYHYLCKLPRIRPQLHDNFSPIKPALQRAKQKTIGGLFVEILPYDDALGMLGVSAQGVCIKLGDGFHLQHQSPAVANLIVRDDNKIWLWGLLIRAQDTPEPTYILNNIQGAFPSRYAKHKEQIRLCVRQILSELGSVYSLDFYFNALRLLNEEEKECRHAGHVVVPSMRLDVGDEGVPDPSFMHPNRKNFLKVSLLRLGKIKEAACTANPAAE